jgi:uncharacterized protein (DUF2252 family)
MTERIVDHATLKERKAAGKAARRRIPRSALGGWEPASDRPDPVALLQSQDETRESDLVPVRHGRMMVSPFTFYRGAAKIMSADLSTIPRAGLDVQLCGDAHLSNFGVFASPERALLFDLNDFDETLPGPFEYDVARLSASFVVAGRDNGFLPAQSAATATAAIGAYRTAMKGFAAMGTLDIWYSKLDADEVIARGLGGVKAKERKQRGKIAAKALAKARTKDSMQALSKLAVVENGEHRIISDPPVIVPGRELAETYGLPEDQVERNVHTLLRAYRSTLPEDRRLLLERFDLVDFARKVVGVGSVGTRAWIALLVGRDGEDPLFLQVKEATRSVLEDHLPKSRFRQPGERVVQGQRLMQAASDIFLGWTKGVEEGRFYYWRQLRDMKGSAVIENMDPATLTYYAGVCGWTLARAHARSGDPVALAAYLGKGDGFDRAMTEFAVRYADQNERDYNAFVKAIRSGTITAEEGV